MLDFLPPYLINTPSMFLNSDLPPKKRRLLAEEDTRESVGSNHEEGTVEGLFFNFGTYKDYLNRKQSMEVVYDNSVITINTDQRENVSMVIHDAESDTSHSQKKKCRRFAISSQKSKIQVPLRPVRLWSSSEDGCDRGIDENLCRIWPTMLR